MRTTEFLPPDRKLVDAVADWLLPRVRTDAAGAPSLSHLLVVVPTAQSGRQLRLALATHATARGWGGILPPEVRLPMQLVVPADETFPTASPMRSRAAFLRFLRTRPRRDTAGGETVLSEWTHLFRPDAVDDFRSVLSFFDQLRDIWTCLSWAGLSMSDVPRNPKARSLLEAAQGDELARWEELADFETAFFAFLRACGFRHEAEAVKLAKTAPRPLPADIEEVVLPALADPVAVLHDVLERQTPPRPIRVLVHADEADADKFDAWGRPEPAAWTGPEWTGNAWKGPPLPLLPGLRDRDIVRAATDAELAQAIARDFPPPGGDAALPALGLCDATLHPELAAAFLQAGRELDNPEKKTVPLSDPGRAACILLAIHQAGPDAVPWDGFAALLRNGDFLSAALQAAGTKPPPTRAQVLEGLDTVRNVFLPRTVPPSAAFDESRIPSFQRVPYTCFRTAARALLALLDAARAAAPDPAGFVREALRRLYAQRRLDAGDEDREFLAAATAIREVLDEADGTAVGAGLSPGALGELFRKSLAEAAYAPEPESKAAIRTEGWLELAWSAADKIALAGFHEGAVPDAVAGHAFLPDSLRGALDLSTNRRRLARDTYLLGDLLAARAGSPGAVRAYVSDASASGDLHRPSRLLFLVPDEALPARARRLFGELPPGLSLPQRELADGWRPALPAEVPPPGKTAATPEGVFSASAIDMWLRCPFRYLFSYGLGMRRVEEKEELEASDFGNIVHKALELYALEQRARTEAGRAQLSDEREIASSLAAIVARIAATFGPALRLDLRLQLDAAARRLACFAPIQAMWAAEGWRIAERPEYPVRTTPFGDADLRGTVVKGSIDRIDARTREDGETEYRIIDYKTWEMRAGAWGRILKGGREAEHALRLRLPVLDAGDPARAKRLLTVQLPLYGRCLETQRPDVFLFPDGTSRIADYCYLLLGRTPEDVAVLGSCRGQGRFEAVKTKNKPALLPLVPLALETAKTAVRRIRADIFWPPGPSEDWKYDWADFSTFSPERDFPPGTAWRDAQEALLAALAEGGGA